MYYWEEDTKIGTIGMIDNNSVITKVYFGTKIGSEEINKKTPIIAKAIKQLQEYLEGRRKQFDIPIKTQGTCFQEQVWKQLQQIPYGSTCSYEDVAKKIGNPKAVRAIGMANNKNPIPILIPCHRVVGKNKKLVGYAGGLEIKETLLQIEGITVINHEKIS